MLGSRISTTFLILSFLTFFALRSNVTGLKILYPQITYPLGLLALLHFPHMSLFLPVEPKPSYNLLQYRTEVSLHALLFNWSLLMLYLSNLHSSFTTMKGLVLGISMGVTKLTLVCTLTSFTKMFILFLLVGGFLP